MAAVDRACAEQVEREASTVLALRMSETRLIRHFLIRMRCVGSQSMGLRVSRIDAR